MTSPTPTTGPGPTAMYPDLADKVVLVTGGSGGIGASTCAALAANGARVAVNGRRLEPITATVEAIGQLGGVAIAAPGDCADADTVDDLYGQWKTPLVRSMSCVPLPVVAAHLRRSPRSPMSSGAPTWTLT